MLLSNLDLLATAPGGVARLRELILPLAVQGKLLPQDPADEPASVLLKKIRAEKDRLIAEGKIKRDKPLAGIEDEEKPFELPQGWKWVRMGALMNSSEAGWSPSCNNTPRCGDDWGVLKVSAVSWGNFNPEANKELPANLAPRPEYEVKDGDFLLSRANTEELVARSVVVGTTPPKLMLSDKIIRLDVSSHVHRAFLNLSNNANHSRAHYVVHASGTSSSMKNVSREVVLNTPVPLPPLAEQSRIVTRVEELMRLCDALEAKGRLEAAQHAQLVTTLLATLTDSATPEALAEHWQRLAYHFDTLLDRPEAVDALEQTILQLAVRGLLVPQDPADEPASVLLKHIRSEKDRLIAAGQIKRDKPLPPITDDEKPFELPSGWTWVRFDELTHPLKPIAYGVLVPGPEMEGGVPFVRIADLSLTDPPAKPEKSISPDVDTQFQRTRLEGGEILMGVVGSIGKLGVAPPTWAGANIARAICRIVPADAGLNEFVLFLLQTEFMQTSFAGDTRTLAQPTLNVGLIRQALTPLPPPAEQSRIVARVESLRRLCADLRQRLSASQTTQAQLAGALVREIS
jgi:type I restriction enzyme S subunit